MFNEDNQDQELLIEQLVLEGEELSENEYWVEAAEKFSEAFSLRQSFDFNKKAAINYIKGNEGYLAEEITSFCYDQYLEKESDIQILISIFLNNDNFLMLNQLENILKNHRKESVEKSFVQKLTKTIEIAERQYVGLEAMNILNQEKELTAIITMPMAQQAAKIKAMKNLPLKNFYNSAKFLLLNPYLHPLLKSDVVENLVKLGIDEMLTMNFWGELREFNPIKLQPISEIKQIKDAKRIFTAKLPRLNDYQLDQRVDEFLMYMSMIYPFNDEIVTNLENWIEVSIEMFEEVRNDVKSASNVENIREWYDKFDKMLTAFAD